MVVAAVLVVAVGALATLGAFAFDDLTGDLPQVSRIEGYFDPASGANCPTQYFDRSGQTALGESASSAPVSLHSPIVDPGLDFLIRATVAYFDPDFWGEEESGSPTLFPGLTSFWRAPSDPARPSLAEQLIRQTILPPGEHRRSPIAQTLRMAFLAADLQGSYTREQILEWYLNSAYFGHGAYGPEAAAHTYFNRELADLGLAQAAMLAAIPSSPDLNPIDAPQQAKARQADVLHAMDDQGEAVTGGSRGGAGLAGAPRSGIARARRPCGGVPGSGPGAASRSPWAGICFPGRAPHRDQPRSRSAAPGGLRRSLTGSTPLG